MSDKVLHVSQEKRRRAGLLDEVRGFCIICMVVYHISFDLYFSYGIDIPIMFDDWFKYVVLFFAGVFIFISGISSRYSRNNAKRGIQCFFLGMLVTFVFAFFAPQAPILFGILHFMGVSMMIYAIGEKVILKIPAKVGIALCLLLFVLTFGVMNGYIGLFEDFSIRLPSFLYDAKLLFPLGFISGSFSSLDYFPLLPWLFVFLAGCYFGGYAVENKLPAFFYKTHIKPLAFVGRYTIWVYLLHQPIAMCIFFVIFGKI